MGLKDFFKKKQKKKKAGGDDEDRTPMTVEEKQLWWDQIEPLDVPIERRWRTNKPRYPYRRKTDHEGLTEAQRAKEVTPEAEPLEPWQLFDESFDPQDLTWATPSTNAGNSATSEEAPAPWQDENTASNIDTETKAYNDPFSYDSPNDHSSLSSDLDPTSNGMPWSELGLSSAATWVDVVERYRELVKAHHPDRHGPDDPAARKAAEGKMAAINAAFDDLNEIYRPTGDT